MRRRCETFLNSSNFTDPIHTLCVVGSRLWVCTGNNASAGTVIIFDLDTGTVRTKVGAALACAHRLIACSINHPHAQSPADGVGFVRYLCWAVGRQKGPGSLPPSGSKQMLIVCTHACLCQAFAAHKGEITSMVAGPGHRYIVTGGVDFQVRIRS